MKIKKGDKIINIGKVKKLNLIGKTIGLMFSRRQKSKIMLFEFRKPTKMRIHSYFVFFPFLAIWLDNKNTIIRIKKIKPFETSNGIKESYFKLIEIPLNNKNKKLIKSLYA